MATKYFVKEVRLRVEFLELSQKVIMKNETFLKTSISGKFNFFKGLKSPNTESSKIACLSRTFIFQIFMGDHKTLIGAWIDLTTSGLKELNEFGCRFGW